MAILIEGCWDDKSLAKFRHFYVGRDTSGDNKINLPHVLRVSIKPFHL